MEQQNPSTINYSALERKIGFMDAVRSAHNIIVNLIIAFGFVAPFVLLFASSNVGASNPVVIVAYLIVFILTGTATYVALAFLNGKNYIKKSSFAADNGFEYITEVKYELNGIFEPISKDGTLTDVVKGEYANNNFWFAEYQYNPSVSNTDKSLQVKTVISYELSNALPNIVLDSKNNSYFGTTIPVELAGNQKLDLEGDFINYFTLYVPRDFERDALYFLTPDLMARIVDLCADYDIEIIGSELRFYSNKMIDFSESGLKKVFEIIDQIGTMLQKNSRSYNHGPAGYGTSQVNAEVVLQRSIKVRMHKINNIIIAVVVIVWAFVVSFILFRTTQG